MFSKPLHCFISGKEETYFSKRVKRKYPAENMCSRHFQGVFSFIQPFSRGIFVLMPYFQGTFFYSGTLF